MHVDDAHHSSLFAQLHTILSFAYSQIMRIGHTQSSIAWMIKTPHAKKYRPSMYATHDGEKHFIHYFEQFYQKGAIHFAQCRNYYAMVASVARKMFIPNAALEKLIGEKTAELRLPRTTFPKLVGVHARRKGAKGKLPSAKWYASETTTALSHHTRIAGVYLMTDDKSFADQLTALLPGVYIFSYPYPQSTSLDADLHLLADTFLLIRHSSFLIGEVSSNLFRFVVEMNGNTFVDADQSTAMTPERTYGSGIWISSKLGHCQEVGILDENDNPTACSIPWVPATGTEKGKNKCKPSADMPDNTRICFDAKRDAWVEVEGASHASSNILYQADLSTSAAQADAENAINSMLNEVNAEPSPGTVSKLTTKPATKPATKPITKGLVGAKPTEIEGFM
jgi:hypothetical protein